MYVRPRRSKSAEGRSWGVARGMSTLRVDAGGARGLSTLHVRAAVALEKKSWGGKQKTGGGRRAARAGRPPGLLYKHGAWRPAGRMSWGVARGLTTLRVDAGGARGLIHLHVRAAAALEERGRKELGRRARHEHPTRGRGRRTRLEHPPCMCDRDRSIDNSIDNAIDRYIELGRHKKRQESGGALRARVARPASCIKMGARGPARGA